MADEQYHRTPGRISKSGLDLIARSPYHYWYKYLNPDYEWGSDDTPALVLGRAVHSAVLEPETFEAEYAVTPEGIDRRTKDGKEAYAEFIASVGKRTILTQEQYATAMAMSKAAWAHPAAAALLSMDGMVEQTLEWTDEQTGVRCKARMDKVTHSGYILDVKSTQDAGPEAFGKSAWNYRYDVQGAFYTDGGIANGIDVQAFCLIAIEKEPPYAVAVYYLDTDDLTIGRDRYIRDLLRYRDCLEAGNWPAYPDGLQRISLPRWATKQ